MTAGMTVGSLIESARRERGLTYFQLGIECDLSTAYVHDICKGRATLSVRAATLLAPVLGLDARALLVVQVETDLVTITSALRAARTVGR